MKKLVSLMFALATVLTLCANPVSRNAARQTAAQFAQKKGAQLVGEPRPAPGRMASASRQPLYVFNMAGNGGFVIVAGDDRAVPVLGYATHGSYDEDLLPDNFRSWLESMALDIEAIGESEDSVTNDSLPTSHYQKIEPFIKTKWGQGRGQAGGYIFNMFCPEIGGKRAITGCVATAGAQIMYYYQHPKDSIGMIPGYSREGAVVNTSEPLDSTIFKWDLMKPEYTSADHGTESAEAVSELMLYCGYAAHMDYGLDGSGSNERVLMENMVKYFDYDPYTAQYLYRSTFSVKAWEETIYNELAEGRPVIYSGNSNRGGHSFLCDGYDGEGFYHFNWGWSGYLDGYFTLYATNPYNIDDISDFGYIFDQTAVIGLQPNTGEVPEVEELLDEPEEPIVIEGIVATAVPSYTSVQGTNMIIFFFNLTEEEQSFDFGLAELMDDGSLNVHIKMNASDKPLQCNMGRGIGFSIPSMNLSEGSHTLVPVSRLKGEEEWRRCKPAEAFYVVKVAADGNIDIIVHPCKKLVINSFEVTSPCLPYQAQTAKLSVTNEGDFYDTSWRFLLDGGNKNDEVLYYNFDGGGRYHSLVKVMIKTGNTKNYDIKFFEDGTVFAPGSYMLKIYDPYSRTIIDSTQLVIGRNLEVTDFVVNGNKYRENNQEVDVTVKNLSGDYTAPLYLFASRTEEKGKSVYAAGIALENGDSTMLKFYFQPDYAGDWNLWVAYDEKGKEVIYHEVVTIVRDPEEVKTAMDMDYDGQITLKDVAALSKNIAKATSPTAFRKADIDGNGRADITDLFILFKAMLPEPEEPVETTNVGWPAAYNGVMLQAFYWDSFDDTQWTKLESQADDLAGTFDLVWLPQSGNCGGRSMGYDDFYWFPGGDHYTSSFGTEAQLRSLISTFKAKGIKTIADVVINHRRNVSNWVDFPKETYKGVTYEMKSTDICRNDDDGGTLSWATTNGYQLSQNNDTGEGWGGMRDLDHNSENVQTIVKAYLDCLKNDLGYAGFRYDMVKGYDPSFIGMYNTSSQPEFSVGECWDSSETIKNWMEGTKADDSIQSAAFDFQFKYVMRNATDKGEWNLLGEQNEGNWPLVSSNFEEGKYRRYAVTFVENHDTQVRHDGSSAGPLRKDTLAANAYMMAMPGTPCVFLPHWQDYSSQIKAMIAARKLAGINSESSYVTVDSSEDYYATVTSTDGEERLLAVVGNTSQFVPLASNPSPQWTKVTEGYHYAYYFPTTMNTAYADLPSGKYEGRQRVMLSAVTAAEEAQVVYTTDGSDPTAASTAVPTGTPITLPFGTTTLKAAILAGDEVGEVITRTYEVIPLDHDVPVHVPSFCVVDEGETCAFFEAPYSWTESITCWAWNGGGANYTGGNWPGQTCQLLGIADNGNSVWKWTYTGTLTMMPEKIIFSNNGAPQTADLPFQNGGYYTEYGLKEIVK